MAREGFSELIALIAVAQTGSFTRAAAQLGVTQPALSASIRGLEERLGVRLVQRSTRSVAMTMAGQHLVERLVPEMNWNPSMTYATDLPERCALPPLTTSYARFCGPD